MNVMHVEDGLRRVVMRRLPQTDVPLVDAAVTVNRLDLSVHLVFRFAGGRSGAARIETDAARMEDHVYWPELADQAALQAAAQWEALRS